jgi:hypothetical protein
MQVSMSEFRARLPELLAKAWAGERLVVVHRPGNQGKERRFVICREEKAVNLSDEQLCKALMIHIAFSQHCSDMTNGEAREIILKLFPREVVDAAREWKDEEPKKEEED